MRRPLIAGNWKMNLGQKEAVLLAQDLRARLGSIPDRDVSVFPTLVSVAAVAEALAGSPIQVGGQNCARYEDGAFTGEVSARILRSTGARGVLLGHSERRHVLGETDEQVKEKLRLALLHGLGPVLCVGETRAERESGMTLSIVDRQLGSALSSVARDEIPRVVIAYEPVWAIGTGLVATPAQAQEVHAHVRGRLREIAGAAGADLRILYGGSVKGSNIDGLMSMPDIDGALVGGASLDCEEFLRIVKFQRRAA